MSSMAFIGHFQSFMEVEWNLFFIIALPERSKKLVTRDFINNSAGKTLND